MNLKDLIKDLINNRTGKGKARNDLKPGEAGENRACRFLKLKGYKIVDKNFRTRFGEIDIIADYNDILCFVEVKARSYSSYGKPEEFVDRRKRAKIEKTALGYISKNNIQATDMRFDVVSVNLNNGECNLIANAFYAGS